MPFPKHSHCSEPEEENSVTHFKTRDDTANLLKSSNNADRLLRSIEHCKQGKLLRNNLLL